MSCSWRELVRVLFSVCLCPQDFVLNIFTFLVCWNRMLLGQELCLKFKHEEWCSSTTHLTVQRHLPGATTTERRVNICCYFSAPWDLSLTDIDAKASKKNKNPGSLTGCLADRLPDLISCPCGKPLSWHFQKSLKPRDGPGSRDGPSRAGFGSGAECELWGAKLGADQCSQWHLLKDHTMLLPQDCSGKSLLKSSLSPFTCQGRKSYPKSQGEERDSRITQIQRFEKNWLRDCWQQGHS